MTNKNEFDQLDKLQSNPSIEVAMKLRLNKFTPKQIAFILYYAGNVEDAAKKAGYKHPKAMEYLLKDERIIGAIIKRQRLLESMPDTLDPILTIKELQQWWTEVILDREQRMAHRLDAAKTLAKSEGAFMETQKENKVEIVIQGMEQKIQIAQGSDIKEDKLVETQEDIDAQIKNEVQIEYTGVNKNEDNKD